MTKKIVVDVMPRGLVSAVVDTKPFDEAKELLEKAGYHIPSLEENAGLRIQEGENSPVCEFGNYVSDGVLFLSDGRSLWTPNSPIMKFSKQATQCHRNGREFCLTPEQVEEGLVGAVEITFSSIPTNRFGEIELTTKAFGKNAKTYGEFLRDSEYKILKMPIDLANISDKPFVRQMWFGRLGDRSELGGDGCLSSGSSVRGVSCSNAEGVASQNFAGYSLEEKRILEEVRNGNLASKELEKILARLK